MITKKKNNQRFFFGWMSYQDKPNNTERECIIVDKEFDCNAHDLVDGEVVEFTPPQSVID